jgi:hypothetical protein
MPVPFGQERSINRGVSIQVAHRVVPTGTLGRATCHSPSFRSVESKPSQLEGMDEVMKPMEKNGFPIIQFSPGKMTFRMFLWRPPQSISDIATMEPALVYEVARGS